MYCDEEYPRNKLKVLTVGEFMEYLAIGKTTAYKLLASGRIKTFKIGSKHKIPVESIEEYVEKERLGR